MTLEISTTEAMTVLGVDRWELYRRIEAVGGIRPRLDRERHQVLIPAESLGDLAAADAHGPD